MALQYQFDVATAAQVSALVVQNLIKACGEDNINPIVIPPLEAFGSWLMADRDRINSGGDALRNPRDKVFAVLKLAIGMPKALSKIVRDSTHLTSSFLFVIGCSSCFDTLKTGQLMHKVMSMNGSFSNYSPSSHLICEFIDKIKGHGDFLQGDSPAQIFNKIIIAVSEQLAWENIRLDDLFDDSEVPDLAEIICNVFEALKNEDVRHITLEGSRSGVWLASLFVWLRPKEVDVSVRNLRVYPAPDKSIGMEAIRLSINFVPPRDIHFSSWSIKKWQFLEKIPDLVTEMKNGKLISKKHSLPLENARYEVATSEASPEFVDAIGHLASALVSMAIRKGTLRDKMNSSVHLIDFCSTWFLNNYPTIMTRFGWENLNGDRINRMTEALKGANMEFPPGGEDEAELLARGISSCFQEYYDTHGEAMLTKNGRREEVIIQYSIHLATEALLLSLCFECPKNAKYRPFETNILNRNAKFLFQVCYNPADSSLVNFRKHVFEALVPSAPLVKSEDLAIFSDGHVAYSAALLALDEDMTDTRTIAAICVGPGALKIDGMQGQFERLVEHTTPNRLASRSFEVNPQPVELFGPNGKYEGIDERSARDSLGINIKHLIAASDDRRSTLYLSTSLCEPPRSGLIMNPDFQREFLPIPTLWSRSIKAIVFATHIDRYMADHEQHKHLAEAWRSEGRLGDNLRWCSVGKYVLDTKSYITTTSDNHQLRFFEAGNLSGNGRLYIRKGNVPLIYCVKEATEQNNKGANGWVIIS